MAAATTSMVGDHYPYHPRALLDIPRRVFRPPDPGAKRVGRVRPLSLTPVYEVNLEDILAEKHLPPLTLTEFEAYLVYTERSPENLHFILWFKDYEKNYTRWTQSPTYPQQSASLATNFSRAQQTFFTPSSPFELNLPQVILSTLQQAIPCAHPAPSAFADMRHQVDMMLRESLTNFVRSRTANTGRNRGLVAIFSGISMMCLGVAPILMSVVGGRSRWLRFAALPCFWFGCTVLLCGLNGVCIIIYLFGDARQLTVYELARPNISHKSFSRNKHPPSKRLSNVSSHRTSPVDYIQFSPPENTDKGDSIQHIADSEVRRWNNSSDVVISPPHPPNEKLQRKSEDPSYPPLSPNSPDAIAPFLSTLSDSPVESSFDFDQLPSRMSPFETGLAGSPPVFAPLTKAMDRISIRTYWETFMWSTTLALLVACILVGVSFAGT